MRRTAATDAATDATDAFQSTPHSMNEANSCAHQKNSPHAVSIHASLNE